jgi:cyclopropane-fatty-acyl-phospholipid synthase
MSTVSKLAIGWTESGLLPDHVIRAGIRRLNVQRLESIHSEDISWVADRMETFVAAMRTAEIAPVPRLANEQHYELPAEFFSHVLGEHGKYSCGFWDESCQSLDQAEAAALEISCKRAAIENGMTVLDLGCGWGSLSLWIASQYPATTVVSVSNSNAQREWITARALERGLDNISVITADMNDFDTSSSFDRIVSVEMFEHMRNYPELFRRIASWLKPGGKFFMHIFCHRNSAYEFLDQGPSDWMSRHFFSGGIMPSADLPVRFQRDLLLEHRAAWNGTHYEKTANAWLQNMDTRKDRIMPLFVDTYGAEHAAQWFQRWRIFFMACAELFGHKDGQEWFVSHYLFGLRDQGSMAAAEGEQP